MLKNNIYLLTLLFSINAAFGVNRAGSISNSDFEIQYEVLYKKVKEQIKLSDVTGAKISLDSLESLVVNLNDQKKEIDLNLLKYQYFSILENRPIDAIEKILDAEFIAEQLNDPHTLFKVQEAMISLQLGIVADFEMGLIYMKKMRSLLKKHPSEFYQHVVDQWFAHSIGFKSNLGIQVSGRDLEEAFAILNNGLLYFNYHQANHEFYYRQCRNNLATFFTDKIGYEKSLAYIEELERIPFSEPFSYSRQVVYRLLLHLKYNEYEKVILHYLENINHVESGTDNTKRYLHGMVSRAFEGLGNYKEALHHRELSGEYQQKVNVASFANKLEQIIAKNENEQQILINDHLNSRFRWSIKIGISILFFGLGMALLALKLRSQKREIEKQKEEIEEVNRAKNKLFAILTHDLRSPISSLNNICQKVDFLISKGRYKELYSMSDQISSRINSLNSLLSNLLPWIISQSKNPDLNKKSFHLRTLIQECISELYGVNEKDIKILNLVNDRTKVFADKNSIRIIIRNLLSNSLKYSPNGTTIKISDVLENNNILIRLEDEGIGVDQSQINKIFKDYVSRPGLNGEIGYGLGLKLSQDLAISNGGNLKLTSIDGGGTLSTLSIPHFDNEFEEVMNAA